jgi:large subunit ribosomal protein L24
MQETSRVKNPRKQRKRYFNAPAHIRHKLMSAPLSSDLAASRGAKTLPVRKGDTVRILRGDNKGFEGKVSRVALKEYRIYIEGLTREKVDGTNIFLPIHPSKVQIRNLNLDDNWRKDILSRKKEIEKPEKAKPSAKPVKKAEKAQPKAEEKGKVVEGKPAEKELEFEVPEEEIATEIKEEKAPAVAKKAPAKKPAAKKEVIPEEEKAPAKEKAPAQEEKAPAKKTAKPRAAAKKATKPTEEKPAKEAAAKKAPAKPRAKKKTSKEPKEEGGQ